MESLDQLETSDSNSSISIKRERAQTMAIYRPPDDSSDRRQRSEADDESAKPRSQPQDEERTKHGLESVFHFLNENPHIREFNKVRNLCGDLVNHPRVQLFILLLIVVNALMMGVATFDFVTENPEVEGAFDLTDNIFLFIFSVELGMQFIFMGFNIFRDGWLVFDFLIIVPSWLLDNLQIIRAFRIFRALRIITRIQTMRNLVTAVLDIMPRLGAITALLSIIFYIFAVLFTDLFGDLELEQPYFTSLDRTVMTLFVFMTMEWAEVAREVMGNDGYWWAWAPFIMFVMVTGFIVFNLIIAVVCDAVAVIENEQNLETNLENSGMGEEGMRGVFQGMESEEKQIIDNLEGRISSVLKTQKEMLATLESLTQRLIATQPSPAQDSSHREDDETSKYR